MKIVNLLFMIIAVLMIGAGIGIHLINDFPDLRFFPSTLVGLGGLMNLVRALLLPEPLRYSEKDVEKKIDEARREWELCEKPIQ